MTPRLIAIEGIDASGKSTLAQHLATALRERGQRVTLTREPGGTPLGQHVRHLLLDPQHAPTPLAELLLYAADRAQHVEAVIRPALSRGETVITDRYIGSTIAYQHYGRGLHPAIIAELNRISTDNLWPHLTILLDLPARQAAKRLQHRQTQDRIERDTLKRLTHVRRGYQQQAQHNPTWLVLNAEQPPATLTRLALERISAPRAA